jgi:hypothetical protein
MDISQEFATALQNKFAAERELAILRGEKNAEFASRYEFTVEHGQKFDRIVQQRQGDAYGRSVHAFVEQSTGKLIKAAGWKAPQKDKSGLAYRYDLSTPEGFKQAVNAADWAGGYLYKK